MGNSYRTAQLCPYCAAHRATLRDLHTACNELLTLTKNEHGDYIAPTPCACDCSPELRETIRKMAPHRVCNLHPEHTLTLCQHCQRYNRSGGAHFYCSRIAPRGPHPVHGGCTIPNPA